MIVQTFVVILTLSVGLISDVTGASFSNVYVESEVAPMGYYSYGTPYPTIANPRLSHINSLPSVPGYVGPCVSPCVYPAQTVATVTAVNQSPKVLTYNAPRAHIVAPTKQEATGYEYSYVVYDENTGDHKAQRELSDGSVVRGEYSFLQPDGYIREVQYVADDVSGFNAVVKNFLPVATEGHKKGTNENKESPPCHEIKNESLKEGSKENSGEISTKHLMRIHEKLHKKHSSEESTEKSKEHHGKSKESEEKENSKEKHHKENKKGSKEESGEESEAESNEKHSKKSKHPKESSGEESEENSKEKPHMKPKHSNESSKEESEEKSKEKHHSKSKKIFKEISSEESEENSEEENHNQSKQSKGGSKEKQHKKSKKESKESGEESEEESESEESKEELKEKTRKKSSKESEETKDKNKKKSKKGSEETSDEDSSEESEEVGHGKHKETHELLKPSNEAVVPYKDILRCIEAAMRKNYGVPAAIRQEPSPLTYIVLNKPC